MTETSSNLCLHPRLNQGQDAILDRLAEQLAEERLSAIAAIKKIITHLGQVLPEGPPGTGEKLVAHFKCALLEIEAIDPTAPPDSENLRYLARRLDKYTELPRVYLLLSRAGSLKKNAQ